VSQSFSSSVGFGRTFIQRIQTEALDSLAVRHPYLQAISSGSFSDVELVVKDFACQYGMYSSHFIQYVSAVVKNISNDAHKSILIRNLEEELGNVHDVDLPEDVLATIIDQPHTQLFRRFQEALGIDGYYPDDLPPCEAGMNWAKQFLQLCEMNQYVGIGAIGIGTEFIVSEIYKQILQGIKKHTNLKAHEHVFFDLHTECDDEHAEQITQITEELLVDSEAGKQIEYGARQALVLRIAFWDAMLERSTKLMMPLEQTTA